MAKTAEGPELKWEFERPGDRERWWVREQLYTIQPKAPLSADVFQDQWGEAVLCIGDDLKFPDSRGFSVRILNGYTYLSPIRVTDEKEIEKRLEHFMARIGGLAETINEDLVRYHAEQDREKAYWDQVGLAEASHLELLAHWRRSLVMLDTFFKLHFLIAFPHHVLAGMLSHEAEDLAGMTDPQEVGKLTQAHGKPRQTDLDMALWLLAADAIAAGLDTLFADTADDGIPAALDGSKEGRAWLAKFNDFLETFGVRQVMPLDLIDPTMKEDPVSVLKTIRSFLAQGGKYDFEGIEAEKTRERDALIEETLARIEGAEAREKFSKLIAAKRKFQAAMEDDNYYLLWAISQVRLVALEAGRRLAQAGVFEAAEDIHFLTKNELETALVDLGAGIYDMTLYGGLAAKRRAEWKVQMKTEPPGYIGDLPDILDDYILNHFWGIRGRAQLDSKDTKIEGLGASQGIIEGVARHVGGLEDFAKVEAGEIVVCRSTSPSWTPLFSKISAVVTDQGGTLSHAAIVAREYGIPAVLGTARATRLIPDGARLRVDGTAGTVEILS